MTNDSPAVPTGTRALAGALEPSLFDASIWNARDLIGMLQHQLNAPIRADLERLSGELARRYDEAVRTEPRSLTFGQLLEQPAPNLKLLELVKDFAKRATAADTGTLPDELGAVLYYAAVCAARLRCDARICSLDDVRFRQGLTWVAAQAWIADPIRRLVDEQLERLDD